MLARLHWLFAASNGVMCIRTLLTTRTHITTCIGYCLTMWKHLYEVNKMKIVIYLRNGLGKPG